MLSCWRAYHAMLSTPARENPTNIGWGSAQTVTLRHCDLTAVLSTVHYCAITGLFDWKHELSYRWCPHLNSMQVIYWSQHSHLAASSPGCQALQISIICDLSPKTCGLTPETRLFRRLRPQLILQYVTGLAIMTSLAVSRWGDRARRLPQWAVVPWAFQLFSYFSCFNLQTTPNIH